MVHKLLNGYRDSVSCQSRGASFVLALFLLLTFLTTSAFAGVDMTVSGPKRYDRYKGAPNLYTDTFDRCEPSNLALLRVTNGNGKDTTITAGQILVNGTVVVTEDDFKQQVFKIEKPISVLPHNELKVELKSSSKERSFILVEVVGRNCDSTKPSIFAPTPADGALLKISRPIISASYRDEANGSGIDPATAKLTLDGVDVTSFATVGADGVSYQPSSDLAFGSHEAVLTVADRGANSADMVWHFTTDTVPPEFKITSPASGSYLNTSFITVAGGINDPSARLTLNGTAVPVDGSSFALPGFALSEGSNTILASATDLAGNVATETVTVILDTHEPVITVASPADGIFLNTPRIAVSGSVDDVSTKVTVNGIAAVVSGTNFSLGDFQLNEGDNLITLAAEDLATNRKSVDVKVHLDTVNPVLLVDVPVSGSWVNTTVITVSGSVVEPNLEELSINGAPTAVSFDRFSRSDFTLTEGSNLVTVLALDKAGNEVRTVVPVNLDTIAPAVFIETPQAGFLTAKAEVTITGTLSEEFTSVTVNGVPAQVVGKSYSLVYTLSQGENVLVVRSVDRAGNAGVAQVAVTFDSIAPTAPVFGPVSTPTRTGTVTLAGRAEAGSEVKIYGGDTLLAKIVADAEGNFALAGVALSAGNNTFTATATDKAANESAISKPLVITFDDRPPTLEVTDPRQDIRTRIPSHTIKGHAADDFTAVSVTVTVDGQSFTPALVNGAFEQAVSFGAEKSYAVTVTATDEVGFTTTVQRNIIFDATPPALTIAPVTTPTNQATQVLSGTTEPGAIVTVACGSANVGAVSYPASGTWSVTLSNLAAANSITVSAEDATGNVTTANTGIIYDNILPIGTIAINAGAAVTGSAAVQLQLSATDASGVIGMRFSNDGTAWTDPVIFAVTSAWTLTAGDGAKKVFVRYLDKAGNWSDPVGADIVLDTTAPVVSITTPVVGAFVRERDAVVSGSVSEAVTSVTVNGVHANVNGLSWSLPVTLSEGNNVFAVSAVDLAGNAGNGTVDVNLDTVIPAVTVSNPQPEFLVNKQQLALSGTVSEPFTVVTVNGRPATVTGTAYSLVYPLEEGGNVLEVRAADRAGNVGSVSVGGTLDSIAPAAPVFASVATPTKVGSVSLSGDAEANATVKIYAAATLLATVSADAQGRFILADAALNEGSNTFTATATDKAVNESAVSQPLVIVLDTKAPQLSVSTLANGSYTNNATLNVAGTATDNVGMKEVTVNGTGVTLNADGSYGHAVVLKEGANQVTVLAVDQAGNQSSDIRTVNLDQALPVITVTAPADNSKTKNPVLEFRGSVDAEARVELSLNGTVYPAVMDGLNFSAALSAAYGYNTVEITAVDLAGNRSTVKRTIVYDDRQPSLAVTDPAQDIRTNKGTHTIKGTAGDELTAVSVTVVVDGQSFTPQVVNGGFEQVVTFGAEKSYAVTVTATDEVGLATTVQRNIIYDVTPPALTIAPVVTPTNQATQVVTGTMEPGAVVTVSCASASVGAVSYPTGGTWSVTLTNLSAAANGIAVAAQDATGNVSTANTGITYDNTLPTGTITVNAGAAVTGNAAVQLQLAATDASGITVMRFSNDGATWTDPVAFAAGASWNLTAGDGTKQVLVRYQDGAGNWSDPIGANITLDTTAPVVSIASPAAGAFVNQLEAVVSGSVSESVASVTVNGTQATVSGLSWSLPVTLSEGINSFTVQVVDLAGNTGSGIVAVSLDTQVPAVTIATPAAGLLTRTPQVTVSGSVSEEQATVSVNGAPATVTGSNWSLVYTLAELGNTLNVVATDRAGNAGSASVSVTLDSTAPAAPVLAAPVTPTKVATLALTGTAEPGATVKIFGGTTLVGTVTADAQGSFTLAEVALVEGNNSFTASATDKAGNESAVSAAVSAVLDTQAPVIVVTAPTEGSFLSVAQVTVTGTLSEPVALFTANGQTVTLAGNAFEQALTLTPGANTITLVATDLAGNSATKTVLVTLDSVPPVVTITAPASGIITRTAPMAVTGSVSKPSTTVTINGTPVTVTGQSFNVLYTLQEGDNTLTVEATDRAGNKGSAAVSLKLDTQAPVVAVNAPGEAAAGANIAISLNASDSNKLSLVELKADGVPIWSGSDLNGVAESIGYRLSPSLSVGAQVLLQAKGVDSAGNETTASATVKITTGAVGPGYLQGKVLDDTRGLRMAGAVVLVTDAAGTAHEMATDTDGGYFAELPSGQTVVTVSRPGYTSVDRVLTILPEKKGLALDARLTKISAATVVDAAGAVVRADVGTGAAKKTVELELPAGAVAASADLRLTPISNQGLAGQLPSGWSPLGAVDLRLLDPATGTSTGTGFAQTATVRFPLSASLLPADAQLFLAVYDAAARQWTATGAASVAADGLSATAAVTGGGEYALVVADATGTAAVAGGALPAAPVQPVDFDAVTAQGKVVPQAAPPATGLKAAGEVVLTANEGAAAPFTSGLLLNSRITENFDLKSGESLQTPSYTQDIVLYRYPCLTNIGSGALSAAQPGVLRTTFPVAPSKDYSIVELLLGKVGLEITVPETVETGVMVGVDGGRLVDADGNILVIPQGALAQTIPVSTRSVAAAADAVGPDFTVLKMVDVSFTGQILSKGAVLSIAAPANLDPSLPLLLARKIEVKGVAKYKLVALVKQGGSLLSSDTALAGLTLSGITSSGSYYFLQATGPIGFVSGTITDGSGNPYPGALVNTDHGSLVDMATATGGYLLAAPAVPLNVTALDLYKNDQVSAGLTLGANQSAVIDLKILMLPPTVASVTPTGVNVQPNAAVVATFSKAMDQASVSAASFTVKDSAGNVIPGVFTYSVDGKTVTFSPSELLKSEQSYSVTLASSLKDLQGYSLGSDAVRSFTVRKTTPPPMPPAGAVSGTFPDADGFVTVTATQGSAEAGNTVLLINDASGEIVTVTPASNGSFTGKVRGQLGDEIQVVLMDHSGNRTLISYLTFKSDDGKYLVTAKGGKVEGEGGTALSIPEGALIGPTIVKMALVPEDGLPHSVPNGGVFAGAVNLDTGGFNWQKPVEISMPAPAGMPEGAVPFLAQPQVYINSAGIEEKVFVIIDSAKVVNGRLTTACPPFDGVMTFGIFSFVYFDPASLLGGPVIFSGTTYQDMDGVSGYTPGVDKPVGGAVIRSPGAENFISYSNSTGHYATYGFTANGVCRSFPTTAIHPLTMNSVTVNLLTCDAPYIVNNFNFKLADKDTVLPDKTPPVIDLQIGVAAGQPAEMRIIAGTVYTGTELTLPVTITDALMGTAGLNVSFQAVGATASVSIAASLTRSGQGQFSTPSGVLHRYIYTPQFGADVAGAQTYRFKPMQEGVYTFRIEASDANDNKSSRSISIRVVSKDRSLGAGVEGAPSVTSVTPADKSSDIIVTTPVTVWFGEPVDKVDEVSFILLDTETGRRVPATVQSRLEGGRMQAVLTPAVNLFYGRKYEIRLLNNITDSYPNQDGTTKPLESFTATFTTKIPQGYELADGGFSGRDIDLYDFTDQDGDHYTYAYETAGIKGWRIIDVTNPMEPSITFPLQDNAFMVNADYRYLSVNNETGIMAMTENITFADGNQYGYVRFYDLAADPDNPPIIGRERLAEGYSGIPSRVALMGNYAYVATINAGLQVVDIDLAKSRQEAGLPSDGSSIVGVFDSVGGGYGQPNDIAIYGTGKAVFTTTSGNLLTLDVSLPQPLLMGRFLNDNYHVLRVAVSPEYEYLDIHGLQAVKDIALASTREGKIITIDLSDPYIPSFIAVTKDPGKNPDTDPNQGDLIAQVRDISIDSKAGLAYVTTTVGVQVVDIKDPANPRLLTTISQLPDSTGATDAQGNPLQIPLGEMPSVVEKDGRAYLASQSRGLVILDMDPHFLKTAPTPISLATNTKGPSLADVSIDYDVFPDKTVKPKSVYIVVLEDENPIWETELPVLEGKGSVTYPAVAEKKEFDVAKRYESAVRLVDENGVPSEGGKTTIPLQWPILSTDYDHNGKIEQTDRNLADSGEIFRFWINNDDDSGDAGGTDLPVKNGNSQDNVINGTRDLVDFFPVHLDMMKLATMYDPDHYVYKLSCDKANINIIETELLADSSGYYLTGDQTDLEPVLKLKSAPTRNVTLNGTALSTTFVKRALTTGNQNAGVVLAEGRYAEQCKLTLKVMQKNKTLYVSAPLKIKVTDVEEMFRQKNLTQLGVLTDGLAKEDSASFQAAAGTKYGMPDREEVTNAPNFEGEKNFVFVHGYNVNGNEARGWHSEIFKRLYWSGSKAKFWGVTWYGWRSQLWIPVLGEVAPNYWINVRQALKTAPELKKFLDTLGSNVTVAAHSLGNMVVSSAIKDHNAKIGTYFMINAAVPSEALLGAEPQEDTMLVNDWAGYKPTLRASEWHTLFNDARSQLTWRDRLASTQQSKYYNFYSPGEDVLSTSWRTQEKLKGTFNLFGLDYGGWGFNVDQYFEITAPSCDGCSDGKVKWPAARANTIVEDELREKPFFKKGAAFEELAVSGMIDPAIVVKQKDKVLAEALPALTTAVGMKATNGLVPANNLDLQNEAKTVKNGIAFWPRENVNWRHSDAKNISYSYVYPLFNYLVSIGGLD